MKYLKTYKLFETRKKDSINLIMNLKINDVISESDVYEYVQQIHNNGDDFIDGNLGKRIEHYPKYKLKEINIDLIDIDEFQLDDGLMDEYINKFEKSGIYPPVVLTYDFRIIDGTHRVNALYNSGQFIVKALIGYGNVNVYDEFEDDYTLESSYTPQDSTERTRDAFIQMHGDEVKKKEKERRDKQEEKKEKERIDIIIDEFDEDTPNSESDFETQEPSMKKNVSLAYGITNMT